MSDFLCCLHYHAMQDIALGLFEPADARLALQDTTFEDAGQ
jgi:hypothetical protein